MNSGKFIGRDIAIGLLFLFIQILLIRHLIIWNLQTDIIFVFFLWLATARERTHALLVTAVVAFFADILLDTWGIRLFASTLVVLLSHGFLYDPNEQKLSPGGIFITVLIVSLIYQLFYLLLATFGGMYILDKTFFVYWIGNSVYISITAFIMYIIKPE